MTPSRSIQVGALLAAIAVVLGAFAAHGLKNHVDPHALDIFNTAARYQMTHAIALVLVGIIAKQQGSHRAPAASWLFLAGILLFCGSLYLLALVGTHWIGVITPVGGIAFIAGWLQLFRFTTTR